MDKLNEQREVAILSTIEQSDLLAQTVMPGWDVVLKVFRNVVLESRDIAMAIDPSERERVAGAHAIAHAQQLFVERVLKIIEDAATAQLAGHKLKAAQELIEDQEFVESIILNQATGN